MVEKIKHDDNQAPAFLRYSLKSKIKMNIFLRKFNKMIFLIRKKFCLQTERPQVQNLLKILIDRFDRSINN